MIQIEIISVGRDALSVAFYYEIPPNLYSSISIDSSRTPKGTHLSPTEVIALQNGTLWELYKTFDIPPNATAAAIRTRLANEWTIHEAEALARYKKLFGLAAYVGYYKTDAGWNSP